MTVKRIALLILLTLALQAGDNYIRIEFPNGGEVLKSGSQVRILWQTLVANGNVAILLFKSGEQYAIIAESIPNSGTYEWKIAATMPDSGQYRLRICLLKNLRVNDFSDRDFAIKK
ncbi:MAG TPA: Ser-Thr-rich GPI-anchored membrane family protein [Patescibacteria group bacterium]|nr:Ser-Thr-rich GPI-anchored membrane family protein [Patescibacteria group bacterium]